jgi:hypothetical protein
MPSKSKKQKLFVGILKVTDENNRTRAGSGPVTKCHGSGTLLYIQVCGISK